MELVRIDLVPASLTLIHNLIKYRVTHSKTRILIRIVVIVNKMHIVLYNLTACMSVSSSPTPVSEHYS